jgi:putative acetyltransferase
MEVRPERRADRTAVRAVHVRAFGERGTVVAALVDALRASIAGHDGLSLVADSGGDVVGHLMLTRSLLDAPRRLVDVQVLSPVAVSPEHQRQGVGSALIREGLRVSVQRGVPVVFLEGDPGYYSRFGFQAADRQGFRKPSLRIPDAAFQAIRLAGHEPWMTGTLIYAETFWRHDCVGLRDPSA